MEKLNLVRYDKKRIVEEMVEVVLEYNSQKGYVTYGEVMEYCIPQGLTISEMETFISAMNRYMYGKETHFLYDNGCNEPFPFCDDVDDIVEKVEEIVKLQELTNLVNKIKDVINEECPKQSRDYYRYLFDVVIDRI